MVASKIGSKVSSSMNGGEPDVAGATAALKELTATKQINSSKYFDTADEAAMEILNVISPVSSEFNIEIGGSITQNRLGFRYTSPHLGNSLSISLIDGLDGYHTHPNEFFQFSNMFDSGTGGSGDVGWLNRSNNKQVALYLGTKVGNHISIGSCSASTCFASPFGTHPGKVLQ